MGGSARVSAKLHVEGSSGSDEGIPGTGGMAATNVRRDGCGSTPRGPMANELGIGYRHFGVGNP